MAIEDALVLAACLDAHAEADADPRAAFTRYEALRRARIAHVVQLTAHNSSQKRANSQLALWIRDLVLSFLIPLGIRSGRKLFRFRVDLNPLTQPV